MEKSSVEKTIIKRYLNKKGYWMRIRKKSPKNNQYIVYYNGIKVFSYETQNKKFELNKAVFLLNTKNYEAINMEPPEKLLEDIKTIEKKGFKFKIQKTILIQSSDNKKKYNQYKEIIQKEICQKCSNYVESCTIDEDKIIVVLKNAESMTFNDMFELAKIGFNITVAKSQKESRGVRKIEINNSIKLEIDEENLEKLKTKDFGTLENIMERRINIYCNPNYKDRKDDFAIPSKTESNQEKQFQQKLMEKIDIAENKSQEIIDENTVPFEMEFTAYQNKKEKGIKSIKGRIDNIFIRNHTLVLVELKYGSGVIGGTNGIHKHLIDILSCFEKEKNKKQILQEVTNYIKEKNEILKNNGITENIINGFDNKNDELEDVEYHIICGYQDKNEVLEAINSIYNKTYREIMIEEENENKLREMIKRGYNKEYINTYKIQDFIKNLKNKKVLRNIKIYLVDDEYKNFEDYKYTK